jgi:hypothetical protein
LACPAVPSPATRDLLWPHAACDNYAKPSSSHSLARVAPPPTPVPAHTLFASRFSRFLHRSAPAHFDTQRQSWDAPARSHVHRFPRQWKKETDTLGCVDISPLMRRSPLFQPQPVLPSSSRRFWSPCSGILSHVWKHVRPSPRLTQIIPVLATICFAVLRRSAMTLPPR